MEFILKGDERIISFLGKLDVAEDSTGDQGSNLCSLTTNQLQKDSRAVCRTDSWHVKVSSPVGGERLLYVGELFRPKKILSIKAIPSKQSMSYLEKR